MRSFYINLARSPARRAFMEQQAGNLGLALERIEAVDGRALAEADYLRLCPDDQGPRIARGELGCFLSHVRAWQSIAAGDTQAAVFEDDVHIARSMLALLTDPGWMPAGAGLTKLTANARRVTLAELPSTTAGGRGVHRMLSPTVDTGGYVITPAHARRLLAACDPYRQPVDRFMMDPRRWPDLYQLVPAGVVQGKWAEFDFLPPEERGSLVQSEKPKRASRSAGAILQGEARNFYARVLTPLALPALQRFRPRAHRVIFAPVPFRE